MKILNITLPTIIINKSSSQSEERILIRDNWMFPFRHPILQHIIRRKIITFRLRKSKNLSTKFHLRFIHIHLS